jgi:hypothetical protein
MKKTILFVLFLLGFFLCAKGQRIEATSCNVTVYTDNGAYVKAKSTNSAPVRCEITYTERYTKDGQTYEAESTYSFGIAANEEKQLFYSQNGVVKITITKCQAEATDGQSSGTGTRPHRDRSSR